MLKFVSKIFRSEPAPSRRRARPSLKKNTAVETKSKVSVATPEDIIAGKGLFWGRYPHYPEMGNAYRALFQRLKIDNQRSIKVIEPACGSDMCVLAGGSGPQIDFTVNDDKAVIVDRHITKMSLGSKIDRIHETDGSAVNRKYFAHIVSFFPKTVNDAELDWDHLGETTLPGGYVIISKLIDAKSNFKKPKPSEKISDNNEFYFYNMIDHSDHWKAHIENRLLHIQNSDPENFSSVSAPVTASFKKEVTEWLSTLQKLKSGELKIMSSIYKHDDVPD